MQNIHYENKFTKTFRPTNILHIFTKFTSDTLNRNIWHSTFWSSWSNSIAHHKKGSLLLSNFCATVISLRFCQKVEFNKVILGILLGVLMSSKDLFQSVLWLGMLPKDIFTKCSSRIKLRLKLLTLSAFLSALCFKVVG